MNEFGRIVNCIDGTPRGIVYEGDSTSHGGVVVKVSGHGQKADGKYNARIGDLTFCPRCKPHYFKISTADPLMLDHGVAVARDMDVTECGAKLIAKHAPQHAIEAANSILNTYQSPFDEQIQAIEKDLKQPLAGVAYYIEREDGVTFFGETDDHGNCPRISSAAALKIKVWFGTAAIFKMFGV